jgi:hypothetical protein
MGSFAMSTTDMPTSGFSIREADHPATRLGELCDLLDGLRAEMVVLDGLRAEMVVLDAVGLHDIARRMQAYERLMRRLVYAAISELCPSAA